MNKKISIGLVLLITIFLSISSVSADFEFKGASDENTVKIGYLPTDHDSALFVADAKELYKEKNITTDLIKYNNGADLMAAMVKGEIDVGYVGIAPALSSIKDDVPAKIISSAQNEGSGIVVSTDSEIKSASDLKGKTIASLGEGSIQNLIISYYLQENGLSTDDVTIENMKATEMNEALRNGEVDAIVTYQPDVTIAENEGYTVLEDSSNLLPNHPCCVVVASDEFLENHKEVAKDILEIHKEATKYINDNIANGNTNEIVELLPDEIVSNDELEAKSLESFPFTSGLSNNFKSDVNTFQQLEESMGLLDNTISQDKLFWEV